MDNRRVTRASSETTKPRKPRKTGSPTKTSPSDKSPTKKASEKTSPKGRRKKRDVKDAIPEEEDVPLSQLKTETKTSAKRGSRAKLAKTLGEDFEKEQLNRGSPGPSIITATPTATTERSSISRSVSRSVIGGDGDYDDQHSEYSDDGEPKSNADKLRRSASYVRRSLSRQVKSFSDKTDTLFNYLSLITWTGVVLTVLFICTTKGCPISKDNLISHITKCKSFFNWKAQLCYLGLALFTALLSNLPAGKKYNLHSNASISTHTFNGFCLATISIIGIFIAEYFGLKAFDLIYHNHVQLFVISIIYALTLSLCLFWRSRNVPQVQWNPAASTLRLLPDLFEGRETNPRIAKLFDVKLACYQLSQALAFILNISILIRNFKINLPSTDAAGNLTLLEKALYVRDNVQYDPTHLTACLFGIMYVCDNLVLEHHLIKSFELRYEGAGLRLLFRYATFPFIYSLAALVSYQNTINNPAWALALIWVLFLVGLFVKRASNQTKFDYYANPDNSKFACE